MIAANCHSEESDGSKDSGRDVTVNCRDEDSDGGEEWLPHDCRDMLMLTLT